MPLHVAAVNGAAAAVDALLRGRAKVNSKDIQGATPLHLACFPTSRKINPAECIKLLIDAKADLFAVDKVFTPLRWIRLR